MTRQLNSGRNSIRRRGNLFFAVYCLVSMFCLSFVFAGCQSGAKINNVTLSLQTIRKTVVSLLPQGLRLESINGRELTSGFFSPRNLEEDATDRPERAYAKVLVLEAARPYRIDVHVFKEKKTKNGTYAKAVEDRKLTQDLVERLKDALADRREDRNIIDDFRAF